jgi:hypothetical protein
MMNTRFVQGLFSIPVATALLLAGCFSGEKNPCGYPTAPQGVTVVSYVSATCAEETSDGSKDLPFATINEAISALNGPGAILIGSGNYTESLIITQNGLGLYGGQDKDKNPSVVLSSASDTATIQIQNATDVALVNLVVPSPVQAGVRIEGGSVTASELAIDGATSDSSGLTGHGVWATGGAKIDIQDSTIQNNAGIGVMLSDAYGIILNNKVASNARGGILANKATDEVEISENNLNSNTIFGIGVVESRGIILNNLVADTSTAAEGAIGDGIHITGAGTYADVQGNEVWKSARSGIFFSGEVRGIILNNMVATNGMGGIWLQNGAGQSAAIELKENQVTSNLFVGIGLSSDAHGIILNNLVANTGALPNTDPASAMGDAILVKNNSWAQVENNVLNNSARAAVLAHFASPDTQVLQNVGAGNVYGVIVQGTEIADFEDLDFAEAEETPNEQGGGTPEEPPGSAQDAFVESAPAEELPVSEDPFDTID